MRFINKSKNRKVRIGKRFDFGWIKVKKGETIDLPEGKGLRYGFEKVPNSAQKSPEVTEGKIGKKKVETKQFKPKEKKNSDYKKEIQNINGIGEKTAEDIIRVYPNKKRLLKDISNHKKLPFRDDIEKILKKKYGKQS